MNILITDCSGPNLKTGLMCGENNFLQSISEGRGNHSKNIIKQIDNLLVSAGITLDNLDVLTVNLGPGSFTGLRIGLSAIDALAQAKSIPVIGFNAFEAMAHNLKSMPGIFLALIPCRGDEYYAANYTSSSGMVELIRDFEIINVTEFELPSQALHLIGSGAEKFYHTLTDRSNDNIVLKDDWDEYPNLKSMAELTVENFTERARPGHNPPDLFYLALSQAEVNYDRTKSDN